MKKVSLALATLLGTTALAFASTQFQAAPKACAQQIGVVELSWMQNNESYNAKQKAISERYKSDADTMKETMQQLQADMDTFAKEKDQLSEEARESKKNDLEKRRQEFAQKNAELSKKQLDEFRQLTTDFIDAVKKTVQQIAEKKGLSVVLVDSDLTMYVNSQLDITKDVVDALKF